MKKIFASVTLAAFMLVGSTAFAYTQDPPAEKKAAPAKPAKKKAAKKKKAAPAKTETEKKQ
jgi:hypothetical protein